MGLVSFVRTIFLSGPSAVSPAPFGVIGLILLLLLLVVGTPVELLNPGTGLQSLAVSIGAYAVGIGLIWKGFDNLQFLRFIRDTPTSDIGSMASGNVEIKAEARRLEDSYSAPFTDEQCIIYCYAIEESTGTGTGEWKTLDSDTSELLFAVEDGTGAAAVDASGAEFRIDHEVEYVEAGTATGCYQRFPGAERPQAVRRQPDRRKAEEVQADVDLTWTRPIHIRGGVQPRRLGRQADTPRLVANIRYIG